MGTTKAKPRSRGKVVATSFRGSFDLEPLRFGEAFDAPEMEEALALEALRRGADTIDVYGLLTAHRQWKRQSRSAHGLRGLGLETSPLSARLEFEAPPDPTPYVDAYRAAVRAEFDGIPDWVRRSFDFDANQRKTVYKDMADDDRRFLFYLKYRPVFYRSGYSRPGEQIFGKLLQPKFLGVTVGGGVFEAFAETLARAEAALTARDPGLPGRLGKSLKSVYGFVPRYIAGSDALSNHAFGMAVDIDPWWNPHLLGAGAAGEKKLGPGDPVFRVLREVTGYDFGEEMSFSSFAAKADRIRDIHARQDEASGRLKQWLRSALPAYIEAERSKPLSGKVTSKGLRKDPLLKEDEFTEGLANQSVDKTQSLPEDAAIDADVKRVAVLVGGYGLDAVKEFARSGIQTVPLELAVALTDAGMRWGSEYQHSKDVMHFELHPAGRWVKPDSGKRKLADLFPRGTSPSLQLGSEWTRLRSR